MPSGLEAAAGAGAAGSTRELAAATRPLCTAPSGPSKGQRPETRRPRPPPVPTCTLWARWLVLPAGGRWGAEPQPLIQLRGRARRPDVPGTQSAAPRSCRGGHSPRPPAGQRGDGGRGMQARAGESGAEASRGTLHGQWPHGGVSGRQGPCRGAPGCGQGWGEGEGCPCSLHLPQPVSTSSRRHQALGLGFCRCGAEMAAPTGTPAIARTW